jgi:DNA-binding response OmpR family regulator
LCWSSAAFDKDRPDMVLVDVLLPRKNGFEVCFDIKRTERGRTVPVVLMSAIYKDLVHAHEYAKTDLGAAGFLVKPFELSDLLSRVHALIGPAAQA